MATSLVANDIQNSLSFFLTSELVDASSGLLSLIEILAIAMLTSGVATNIAKYAKQAADGIDQEARPTQRSLMRVTSEFFSTVGFLSATIVVQSSVKLARAELTLPIARLSAVVMTVFVARLVLSASVLSTHRAGVDKLD